MYAFSAGKRHVFDAVNVIHDVIKIPNPFPYTATFMFVGVKLKKSTSQTLKDK